MNKKAFQEFGRALQGIGIASRPMVKLAADYESYVAYCGALGLNAEAASAIIFGVQHIAKQTSYPWDVFDEARAAARDLAAYRSRQGSS